MGGALCLALFFLAIAWRSPNLDAFGLSNDEGVYLMWGALNRRWLRPLPRHRGRAAPAFFETLALAFRLFGETMVVGRWAMMVGFGLLAGLLSWLAYRTGRWPAAIAALVLTSLAPLLFSLSRWRWPKSRPPLWRCWPGPGPPFCRNRAARLAGRLRFGLWSQSHLQIAQPISGSADFGHALPLPPPPPQIVARFAA